ncbi:MAG: hypothetical protein E6Q69_03280 [Aquipseudomonas alcaligenes]|uniref:Uncharacterized protein n=1 Tax=Aquipseudomonas alcaligenes TaxID=43263 RepID=A0A5C7WCE8_AQUAC|nr:MAG: hypothetical protein E6Q69_03280 [Pseudomonas alcaligenes]
MAVDDFTIEYHLTDEGWVSGSTTFFKNQDHFAERPVSAHETWLYRCYQKSGWSKEEESFSRIWVNPASDPSHVRSLHQMYPAPR